MGETAPKVMKMDTPLKPNIPSRQTGTDVDTNTTPVIILCTETLREDIRNLTQEQRAAIAFELGMVERNSLKKDAIMLSEKRGIKELLACQPDQYLFELNPVVTNFLSAMANTKPTNAQFPTEPYAFYCWLLPGKTLSYHLLNIKQRQSI